MRAEKRLILQAHYGIRNTRYKLIFWYNLGYSLPGTSHGGEEQEWEFFDCEKDPMELFNLWADNDEQIKSAKEMAMRALEREMEAIGDIPAHKIGQHVTELMKVYPGGTTANEAKFQQRNV